MPYGWRATFRCLRFGTLLLGLLGCGWARPAFTPAAWKAAKPEQRRKLAEAFLRRYDVRTLTLKQVKGLLGMPDSEQDVWRYHLSARGAPPGGPQPMQVFQDYPQLWLFFEEGAVRDATLSYGLDLKRQKPFSGHAWRRAAPSQRGAMAADLIGRKVLTGKRKQAVLTTLGKPDGANPERVISYDLGWSMVDPVTLDLTVNAQDRVTGGQVLFH